MHARILRLLLTGGSVVNNLNGMKNILTNGGTSMFRENFINVMDDYHLGVFSGRKKDEQLE
ncbi:AAEL009425-PA [Aedes aegypti]|uniref:AAEL009425-PA n=1 Tax=Aedes aegypti TaxID=7159 RepID=Q16VU5_AEDAE|nr:AAEL009425-PA [Aedes aegypti]